MRRMIRQHRIFFICTGNYYRSRHAELYFNARVPAHCGWRAVSRGFQVNQGNLGPIAPAVKERLRGRRVADADLERAPRQLRVRELTAGDRIIVMDEREHRPYVERLLPAWRKQITYWHVPDIAAMPVKRAFQLIESEVEALLQQLPNNIGDQK